MQDVKYLVALNLAFRTVVGMHEDQKRLFFGMEVHAPWPEQLSQMPNSGRIIAAECRHITLAFLGNQSFIALQSLLPQFPSPSFQVGFPGYFDQCLFLPPRHPHVVAWHLQLYDLQPLAAFQSLLTSWLSKHSLPVDDREWLPHLTLCRKPFDPHLWEKSFSPLPFYCSSIHLYESKGNLSYVPLWSYEILPPFQEIEHQADLAFLVYGETPTHLYYNAFTALAFKYPALLPFFKKMEAIADQEEMVIALNESITAADSSCGSPFKAVSFHGEIEHAPTIRAYSTVLQWEMIVDV